MEGDLEEMIGDQVQVRMVPDPPLDKNAIPEFLQRRQGPDADIRPGD